MEKLRCLKTVLILLLSSLSSSLWQT